MDDRYSRDRSSGRGNSIFDNDRDRSRSSGGGGFLERAGETIQSWVGGDDRDGRAGHDRDRHREQNSGFFGRDVGYGGGSGGGWGEPAYGDRDRDRGGLEHYAGRGGGYGDGGGRYQRGQWGGGAGSFGRRDHPQSVGEANQSMDDSWTTTRDTNRSGTGRDHFDDHYHQWREQQVAQFDNDYAEYRREQQQQFHSAFDSWRQRKRQGGAAPSGNDESVIDVDTGSRNR